MELKPGYKQTEVGVIPEDWEVATAEMICELIVDCKNRTPSVINDDEFAVVRTPNVRNGKFIREDLRFTDEHCFMEWTARAVPKDGDILITREAPLGEVCLVPTDVKVCLGQRMMLYRPDPIKVVSGFFLYCLMSSGVRSTLLKKIGGSTVGHAKVDDIRNLQVPLPTKAEQEAIAEALSDADALIESLEQLIAKKRQIKQGAMQELLTGKNRLPGFSGEWEVKTLGEIANIKTGSINNQDKIEDGEYPFFVRSYTIERINSYSHDCEAILVPGEGGIGSIFHYINGRFNVHQRVYAITKFPENISGRFVFYYMIKNFGWHAMQNSVKATVDSLRLPTFQDFEMSVPAAHEEQSAIATILSDMDKEIDVLEVKLLKSRQIKQGMMQNLLTGKIRLV